MRKSSKSKRGKSFYIENVGGAGGNTGTGRAAQSAPDGYTILVTGGNITNNPYLYNHVPYDPLKDFDAVTLGGSTPVVLAVNPSVPAHTVKELVALISHSGKYSYACRSDQIQRRNLIRCDGHRKRSSCALYRSDFQNNSALNRDSASNRGHSRAREALKSGLRCRICKQTVWMFAQ